MGNAFRDLARHIRRAAREAALDKREENLRELVVERHREAYAEVPVGSMEDLGPAVLGLELWNMTPDGFIWGTTIGYAGEYAAYREAQLGEPLLYADPVLADRVFDSWCAAVFEVWE